MGNQQQNCNLKFTGKTIKSEYYIDILNEYVSGKSLMQLSNKYNYNIATIRHFLLKNDIKVRNVKESDGTGRHVIPSPLGCYGSRRRRRRTYQIGFGHRRIVG